MAGLETVLMRLQHDSIEAEIWIDGSFVTDKEDPADSDIVAVVRSESVENATAPQFATLGWLATNLKTDLLCHLFIHVEHDPFDEAGQFSAWMRSYWIKQFGFGRSAELKGIAVIRTY